MAEDYSLESILAEIKGSAFINGDKKTPSDILEAEAERILREASAQAAPAPEPEPEPAQVMQQAPIQADEMKAPDIILTDDEEFDDEDDEPMSPVSDDTQVFDISLDDTGEISYDRSNLTATDMQPINEMSFDNADSDDSYATPADTQGELPVMKYDNRTLFDQATVSEDEEMGREPEEEEQYEEPRLKDAAVRFAKSCNSLSMRLLPAALISLLMVLITFVYDSGLVVPFGIGHNLDYAAGTLVVCLLIVMMLCVEVVVRGVDFLIRGTANAETLIVFSCAFSIVSATFTMLSGTALMLPFCAVSALSLTFAAYGEKFSLRAMTDTLKTAVGSSEPYGVQAEYNEDIDKSVLKKSYSRTDGFYNNLMQPDITEVLYQQAAPILLIVALALTVLSVIINDTVENALHILSALLAAAAPFSALMSYSIPFSFVAKAVRKSGVALAGWGGADDISFTDGVCVTDDDLFPPGTLRLSGVKVYDGAAPNNAMCYTASLIIASGSGMTSLFAEVIKQQGISALRVSDFECHESGISAIIQGHQVATGSAAFMNLIGVRVPDDANLKNAVFTAVNNRLIAMFAVEYKPLPSVQSALIAMLKWRIDLFFAMRDFNITPSMVGQKFKVPFESFVFVPVKDSYSISDPYSGKQGRMAAVLVREGLGPYAEAITGGRLLRSASFFATILSIASAALGVILMFLMCWSGSFLSAKPGNLIIFMLCMLTTVLIVCGYVRLKK
ncbi:MAG: hypothetical protein FWD44_06150 [Oscillospiraceae bacterium]|nr:hypothetical protein [Oscillospiraceae bacterium]